MATEAMMPDDFPARGEWSADLAVIELYSMHYRALVRLAAMLVRDTPTAEEVVQEAFVAMHDGWQRLRDTEKALAYLRQAVVNRSRSVLRHRTVVEKNAQQALRFADRLYVLAQGSVVLTGRPVDLERDPNLLAAYLGRD